MCKQKLTQGAALAHTTRAVLCNPSLHLPVVENV